MLESLVTTVDLRTADLDQRLSRFTALLDESLAAAEERARDIARVVAETAGAGSAAISRQFEAVRVSAEEERRLTADTMAQIYQQSTQEADAMFKQSADKFANMVASMKEMAAEMHARARRHPRRACAVACWKCRRKPRKAPRRCARSSSTRSKPWPN